MSKNRNNQQTGERIEVFAELKSAGILAVSVGAVMAVFIYTMVLFWIRGEDGFSNLGQFGDSFGALTSLFNALAFSAVVATVVLQSKELRESRQELSKQAVAQKAWADAALRQIEVTERLERLKIRPILSLVWNDRVRKSSSGRSLYRAYLVVRNVGLGAAFIDEIGVGFGDGTVFSYQSTDEPDVKDRWGSTLQRAGIGHDMYSETKMGRLRDRNRAVAPAAEFEVIEIRFVDKARFDAAKRVIQANLQLHVKFRSLDDEVFDTRTQHLLRRGGADLSAQTAVGA